MKKQAEKRVLNVLSRVTGIQTESFDYDTELKDELGLDSIQIVEFFAALEIEFATELPLKMMTVRTAREFMDLLEREVRYKEVA